jgi:hypothetical protein
MSWPSSPHGLTKTKSNQSYHEIPQLQRKLLILIENESDLRKLKIRSLEPRTSLVKSDFEPYLQAVLLRIHRIRKRKVISTRRLNQSHIGFRKVAGLRNIPNKTTRPGKV